MIDWSTQPLGQMFDSVLAKRLGVSRARVQRMRAKRKIPRYVEPEPAWVSLLGTVPDMHIAKKFRVPPSAVWEARKKRSIPSHQEQQRRDWSKQPLGKVSDNSLAKKLGEALSVVRRARVRLKIAPFLPHRRKGINWDAQPLGKVSDGELAKRQGVTVPSVRSARVCRGIPAFQRGEKKT